LWLKYSFSKIGTNILVLINKNKSKNLYKMVSCRYLMADGSKMTKLFATWMIFWTSTQSDLYFCIDSSGFKLKLDGRLIVSVIHILKSPFSTYLDISSSKFKESMIDTFTIVKEAVFYNSTGHLCQILIIRNTEALWL